MGTIRRTPQYFVAVETVKPPRHTFRKFFSSTAPRKLATVSKSGNRRRSVIMHTRNTNQHAACKIAITVQANRVSVIPHLPSEQHRPNRPISHLQNAPEERFHTSGSRSEGAQAFAFLNAGHANHNASSDTLMPRGGSRAITHRHNTPPPLPLPVFTYPRSHRSSVLQQA